ncbi:MAG TPA: hypothetical protein ENJ19_04750 [Gammaproteobacteria bacterium]|nr:hypothetical protein [Gammaproteobacteria bacterium]
MTQAKDLFDIISPLVAYNEKDWDVLAGEAGQISTWVPDLVDVFYNTLYGHDSTKTIFQDGERPKLEKTLQDWVASLVSGPKGADFWDHQWVIALLHVRRGVRNLYMLGMMNRIQQVFLAKCVETYDKDKAHEVFSAFLRISGTVAALIAECYGALLENSTEEGLSKVGMNAALLQRIKDNQISKMIQESQHND